MKSNNVSKVAISLNSVKPLIQHAQNFISSRTFSVPHKALINNFPENFTILIINLFRNF